MTEGMPTHSSAFRTRRFLNWFPLGLAYAFLYMGRYNLTVAKNALPEALMTKGDFGLIFGVGAVVYAHAFLLNGPLTDRFGGRRAMLIGVFGSMVANFAMGLVLWGVVVGGWDVSVKWAFVVLYSVNMYFQSFGAVAIVTTKAPWFHVRERGTFSTIFGVMISMGIYFAFDWGAAIVAATRVAPGDLGVVASMFRAILPLDTTSTLNQDWWVFFTPSALLVIFWTILFLFLRNSPGEAGHDDFDTGEESLAGDGQRLPVLVVFKKILTHPVLVVICGIEFCSGVVRNGVMHWYLFFAKETGFRGHFWIPQNWGLALMIAGIIGAFATGWASDRFFQSRRAPMSAVLYGVIVLAMTVSVFTLDANLWYVGLSVLMVSSAVIGVHGIMSGTSTADFGGSKNVGAAVGIVDGLVYYGTGLQSFVLGNILPTGAEAKDPNNWIAWPVFILPFGIIGFLLSLKIWNALPRKRGAVKVETDEAAEPATST